MKSLRTSLLLLIVMPLWADNAFLSPLTMVAHGDKIYIAQHTANRIDIWDIAAETIKDSINLPGPAMGLALVDGGKTLYATIAQADGLLCQIDLQTNRIIASYDIGHTPETILAGPDGDTLFITSRFDNKLYISQRGDSSITTIDLLREPRALALNSDASKIIVCNFLPDGAASENDYVAGKVAIIDRAGKAVKNIVLPNGSSLLAGVCVSPDDKYAYITHLLGRYQLPANQIERGWIMTNALSIIDLNSETLYKTVLLDDVDLGAANPWAIACSDDGSKLYITHSGSDALSIIDRAALHKEAGSDRDSQRDLQLMARINRQRITPGVKGPKGLLLTKDKIWVSGYYSDSIAAIDINAPEKEPQLYPLNAKAVMSASRRGEMLYNDATICFQQWLSCASCHPDGRVDGLNWDELNDGIGNPKQTKSHLYSHFTPPTTITGVRPNAETSVRAGILYNYFQIRPDDEAAAIDTYLKALQPVSSPRLVDGQLSAAARRGKLIFEGSANCASCHSGPYLTDMKLHNVGTGLDMHSETRFDTPSLKEIWRTAPYLYDGRAKNMMEVLTIYNKNDKHGTTSNLSQQQLNDLAEYILSL